MSETEKKADSEKVEKKEDQKDEKGKKVEIDADVYEALLDKLDELEAKGKKEKPGDETDDLVKEAKDGAKAAQKEINLDELTPTQLANVIMTEVNSSIMRPLQVAIEEVRIQGEIDRLTRPKEAGGKGITDFWDYRDEIFQLASQNPSLNLEKAYKLAKQEAEERGEKPAKANREERDAKLRHLPKVQPFGERPGAAESSVSKSEPKSLKEASERAWDELKIKVPDEKRE